MVHKPLPHLAGVTGESMHLILGPALSPISLTLTDFDHKKVTSQAGSLPQSPWHYPLCPCIPSGFHSCRPDLYFPLSISHTQASQACAPMGCFHKAALVTSVATSMGTCAWGSSSVPSSPGPRGKEYRQLGRLPKRKGTALTHHLYPTHPVCNEKGGQEKAGLQTVS